MRDLVLLYMRRCNIEVIKSVPKNTQPSEDLSLQAPWGTVRLTPPCTPSGLLKATSCSSVGSISVEADGKCLCGSVIDSALGKCQFVVDSGNLCSSSFAFPSMETLSYDQAMETVTRISISLACDTWDRVCVLWIFAEWKKTALDLYNVLAWSRDSVILNEGME